MPTFTYFQRRLFSTLCISLLSLYATTSVAQVVPKTPLTSLMGKTGSPSSPAETSAAQSAERTSADIDAQLAEIQKRHEQALAELAKSQNAQKTISPSDTAARDTAQETTVFWQQQVDLLFQIIDSLKDLRRLTDKVVAKKKEKESWRPPQGTPPWPLSVADELQFSMMQMQYQIQHLDQRLAILDEQLNDAKKLRAQQEIDLRQAGDNPALNRKRENLKRQIENNNNYLTITSIDKEVVTAERTLSSLNLTMLNNNWAFYKNRFAFDENDLNKAQSLLEKEIEKLRVQETQASAKINRTLDMAAQSKSRFEQLETTPNTRPEAITIARREWRKADGLAQAARIEREKYRALIDLNNIQIQLWKIRFELYSPTLTAAKTSKMKESQEVLVRRLDQGLHYLTQMIAEKSQSSFELAEQARVAQDPAEKAFLLLLAKPLNEQIENARALYSEVGRVRQLLEITQNEINSKDSSRSLRQRLDAVKVLALDYSKTIWNYELFAVDDIVLVDGREIKTKRSITIGKSIGAITILIVGFMLISGLIRRTLALAVKQAHLGASKSVILARWLTLLAGITLIILAFNLVEIPLSAFAFFGGALAIGVGFGTQNLVKNLISGVMLLIEKPIRIGDLVEIDGVSGVVTSIGIRFSTIHGAHGTDTLIPNSVLVEQKLVNWTYSTPDVRKEIKLTVGYNSDTEVVLEILHRVCLSHPAVMHTPPPLVTLDDFGDNGLVFSLQCWMRIQSGLVISQVLSELRMEILKAFYEAGIELPSPQRVVQFDNTQPLQVNINSVPPGQQS